ncbi:MAG: hypothetical protein IJ759_06455 [Bacteroidales bacterium]|nr:hypothetical protein [Bacteroidales bacterium]
MKRIISFIAVFILCFCQIICAQEWDFGKLQKANYRYAIYQTVISPKGNIFVLTRGGEIFRANNENSPLELVFNITTYNKKNKEFLIYFDQIMFFNSDTAIITGNMDYWLDRFNSRKYYLTTYDGGKTWKRRKFPKNNHYDIDKACINQKGECWAVNTNGTIFYSNNYGKSFKILSKPFSPKECGGSIYMQSSEAGIATSYRYDKIYLTDNNWQTYDSVSTPFQEGFLHDKNLSNIGYHKCGIWKDWYLVRSNEYPEKVFYSEKDNIKWQKFDVTALDFEIQNDSLIIITNDNKYLFTENINSKEPYRPKYLMTSDGYKVSIITNNDTVIKPLYLNIPKDSNSYEDLDSEYNIITPPPYNLLKDFATSDIKQLIFKHTQYNMHDDPYETIYNFKSSGDSLVCSKAKGYYASKEFDTTSYPIVISRNEIKDLIKHINENPQWIPDLMDFNIKSEDIDTYKKEIDSMFSPGKGGFEATKMIKDSAYYRDFGTQLDTIGSETFKTFLLRDNYKYSYYALQNEIMIINNTDDTLFISNAGIWPYSFDLPFFISLNGERFYISYDINITKILTKYYPMSIKEQQHKVKLIKELAEFILHKYRLENY